MILLALVVFFSCFVGINCQGHQHVLNKQGCFPYEEYSKVGHPPYKGSLMLPYQRPPDACKTYQSQIIEDTISMYKSRLSDPNHARLFENCFANTLDTTIGWHTDAASDGLPRTFVTTGDIKAEWMRDARFQLRNYMMLAPYDDDLQQLLEGAIHTQAEFLLDWPYCNAMQPPAESEIGPVPKQDRKVLTKPKVDYQQVWECKWEVDSVASFLGLASDYYEATEDLDFVNERWVRAVKKVYQTLLDQQGGTFDMNGKVKDYKYKYQSVTFLGTETLSLDGIGNPLNDNTRLIRSAFRPSDDATIFQFFIPGNALLSVELRRTAYILYEANQIKLAHQLKRLGEAIEEDVWKYGTFDHPEFGHVFAYEVDGYGGTVVMDDANVPSLLSLPDFGFVEADNDVYENTRRMVLSQSGNPYYSSGDFFSGIGSPHIGLSYAWPMSHILSIRTSNNDEEIKFNLDMLKNSTSSLGLMHEAVSVDKEDKFTRPWFAWVNSEYARTIVDLAARKPHLVLKEDDDLIIDEVVLM